MKAIKLTYLSVFLAGAAFLMNSCSSTQQFAGTYPQNRITGKGPGYGAVENKTQPTPNTVANTEVKSTKVTTLAETTVAAAAQPAPTTTKAVHAANKPFLAAFGKATGMLSGFKEKMTNKIVTHIMKKYGVSSSELAAALATSSSSSLESVSRPLAITSLVTGCVAVVSYFGAFFFGPAAIVTGALALVGIKRGGDGKKAFAIAGIALGAFGMLLWLLLWIVIFSVATGVII